MTCWAYFPKEGAPGETMEQHVKTGLELIEQRYIKRGYSIYVAKELGLCKKEAEDLLKLVYILHDAGKGLDWFQERGVSFGGHQEYSASIAYHVLKEYKEDIRRIAACAILLHHHDWKKIKSQSIGDGNLSEECKSCFHSNFGVTLPGRVRPLSPALIDETLTHNLKKVYSLLLPIVVADNYAAIKNRNPRKGDLTPLGREVMESQKYYAGVR